MQGARPSRRPTFYPRVAEARLARNLAPSQIPSLPPPIGWPPPPPIVPRPVAAAAAPVFPPIAPRFIAAADREDPDHTPSMSRMPSLRKQARSMTRRRAERVPPGRRQATPPSLSGVRQRVSGERRVPPLTSTTRRRASLRAGRTG
jgi:hypothetical protein